MILVDTPIWSEYVRRSSPHPGVRRALVELVDGGLATLIGPVRQEVLSGIRDFDRYAALRDALREFPDLPIETADYEQAAGMLNTCRAKGIQGSNTDFLICAISIRIRGPIFTLDYDFDSFATVLPIQLHKIR